MRTASTLRPAPLAILPLLLGAAACDGTGFDPSSDAPAAVSADVAEDPTWAASDPEACDGRLGAVTVETVDVPPGATCLLDGTRVEGNVFVRADARLAARGARIDGNIQAEDALAVLTSAGTFVGGDLQAKRRAHVRVVDTTIDGNLQVEEGGASLEVLTTRVDGDLQHKKAGSALVTDAVVLGNLQLEKNHGPLETRVTRVRGNLQVFENRGGVTLVGNRVEQSLQCDENEPAPTGGDNTAGEKEGQCAGL